MDPLPQSTTKFINVKTEEGVVRLTSQEEVTQLVRSSMRRARASSTPRKHQSIQQHTSSQQHATPSPHFYTPRSNPGTPWSNSSPRGGPPMPESSERVLSPRNEVAALSPVREAFVEKKVASESPSRSSYTVSTQAEGQKTMSQDEMRQMIRSSMQRARLGVQKGGAEITVLEAQEEAKQAVASPVGSAQRQFTWSYDKDADEKYESEVSSSEDEKMESTIASSELDEEESDGSETQDSDYEELVTAMESQAEIQDDVSSKGEDDDDTTSPESVTEEAEAMTSTAFLAIPNERLVTNIINTMTQASETSSTLSPTSLQEPHAQAEVLEKMHQIVREDKINEMVEKSMEKAEEQIGELLHVASREDGTATALSAAEQEQQIGDIIRETMQKARMMAQQEIHALVQDSMQAARQSVEEEIKELVRNSAKSVVESVQLGIEETVEKSKSTELSRLSVKVEEVEAISTKSGRSFSMEKACMSPWTTTPRNQVSSPSFSVSSAKDEGKESSEQVNETSQVTSPLEQVEKSAGGKTAAVSSTLEASDDMSTSPPEKSSEKQLKSSLKESKFIQTSEYKDPKPFSSPVVSTATNTVPRKVVPTLNRTSLLSRSNSSDAKDTDTSSVISSAPAEAGADSNPWFVGPNPWDIDPSAIFSLSSPTKSSFQERQSFSPVVEEEKEEIDEEENERPLSLVAEVHVEEHDTPIEVEVEENMSGIEVRPKDHIVKAHDNDAPHEIEVDMEQQWLDKLRSGSDRTEDDGTQSQEPQQVVETTARSKRKQPPADVWRGEENKASLKQPSNVVERLDNLRVIDIPLKHARSTDGNESGKQNRFRSLRPVPASRPYDEDSDLLFAPLKACLSEGEPVVLIDEGKRVMSKDQMSKAMVHLRSLKKDRTLFVPISKGSETPVPNEPTSSSSPEPPEDVIDLTKGRSKPLCTSLASQESMASCTSPRSDAMSGRSAFDEFKADPDVSKPSRGVASSGTGESEDEFQELIKGWIEKKETATSSEAPFSAWVTDSLMDKEEETSRPSKRSGKYSTVIAKVQQAQMQESDVEEAESFETGAETVVTDEFLAKIASLKGAKLSAGEMTKIMKATATRHISVHKARDRARGGQGRKAVADYLESGLESSLESQFCMNIMDLLEVDEEEEEDDDTLDEGSSSQQGRNIGEQRGSLSPESTWASEVLENSSSDSDGGSGSGSATEYTTATASYVAPGALSYSFSRGQRTHIDDLESVGESVRSNGENRGFSPGWWRT